MACCRGDAAGVGTSKPEFIGEDRVVKPECFLFLATGVVVSHIPPERNLNNQGRAFCWVFDVSPLSCSDATLTGEAASFPGQRETLAARPEDWLPSSDDGRAESKVETQPRLNRRGLSHQPQNYFWKTAVRWGKLFAVVLWT